MNVVILGKTNVGKTPLVNMIKEEYPNINIISASKWIKDIYVRPKDLSKEEYVKDISKFSIKKLKENKDLDYICIRNSLTNKVNIIDGIRNPYTFNRVFNPNEDKVILIIKKDDNRLFSIFDKGVDVIRENIDWLISVGLMNSSSFKIINYKNRIADEIDVKDII